MHLFSLCSPLSCHDSFLLSIRSIWDLSGCTQWQLINYNYQLSRLTARATSFSQISRELLRFRPREPAQSTHLSVENRPGQSSSPHFEYYLAVLLVVVRRSISSSWLHSPPSCAESSPLRNRGSGPRSSCSFCFSASGYH